MPFINFDVQMDTAAGEKRQYSIMDKIIIKEKKKKLITKLNI